MPALSPTTPFGRRPLSLGLVAGHLALRDAAAATAAPAAVNKWALCKALTAARRPLGLADRTLALLNALLSFHPETALSLPPAGAAADPAEPEEDGPDAGLDLVVFPSNRALAERAHGMAEKTIRRHLAALVEAGLIARRDSPNGKRYARRAGEGFCDAFGFDLTPLVLRAGEIEALAEAEKRRALRLRRLRERLSLMRRDIAKSLALALDAGFAGDWETPRRAFLAGMTPLRRIGEDEPRLARLVQETASLRQQITEMLESQIKTTDSTGNDGTSDRHKTNSNPDPHSDPEPAFEKDRGEAGACPPDAGAEGPPQGLSLGMVLEACPDVNTYAASGRVRSWPEFAETMRLIRPMLGISPDAWRAACAALGEPEALIAVAAILQRSEFSSEAKPGPSGGVTVNGSPAVRSPGGYLRALTAKAGEGGLALAPVLMAQLGQRLKRRGAE